MPLGCDHFLLRHWHCVKEGLHRCFAEAPASLMRAGLIVFPHPSIKIGLQLVNGTIHLFAERDAVKFVEHGFVELFTNWSACSWFGARVIDVLDREVELILVPLRVAAVLAAAVGQRPQQLDLVAVKEGEHTIIEEIGGRDRRLAIVELGKGHLGIDVDEGLLVDASNPLQIADIERILSAAITRMLALELAMRLLLLLGFLQGGELGLGQHAEQP